MRLFYPNFFSKLSVDEVDYLHANEEWVLEIFGDFWEILMRKFNDPECRPGPPTGGRTEQIPNIPPFD
jgi:hypothetical protein